MRSRAGFLALSVGCAACGLGNGDDFPESAVAFTPPPSFETWWQVVEDCAGRRSSFTDVSWYTARRSALVVHGEPAYGAWFANRNRIVLADDGRGIPALVRHEMLHAIIREEGHPATYFHQRCADEVLCGRECGPLVSFDNAREVTRATLTVNARLFPETPSLSAQEGLATAVVHVRNPLNEPVFVRMGTAICPAGIQVASVSQPTLRKQMCDDLPGTIGDAVTFGPGETLRLVFEVDLVGGWTNGAPGAGEISVRAVLADVIRETRVTAILP